MRRTKDILTGLMSLILLAAVEIGLPLGLFASIAVLSPSIGLAHPSDLLRPHSSAAALLLGLSVIVAIGWLLFTISIVIECAARARHIPTPRLPGLGGAQRGAANLIAGVLLMVPASGAMISVAAAPAPVSASAPLSTGASFSADNIQLSADEVANSSTSASPTATHEVQPGESLWSIARDHLGDGEKWRQIAQLNADRTFGGHRFDPDAPIHTGWHITIPATAASAAAHHGTANHGSADTHTDSAPSHPSTASTTHSTETEHTVVRGDNLWNIAAQDLGDGADYQQVFAANEGKPQPGGLPTITNANLIIPGQHLIIPHLAAAPATDTTTRPSTTQPPPPATTTAPTQAPARTEPATVSSTPATQTPSRANASDPATAAPSDQTPSTPTPSTAAPSTQTPSSDPAAASGQGGNAPTSAPSQQAQSHQAADAHESADDTVAIVVGTLLTGFVLITALTLRRRLQQRARARTDLIALPGPRTAAFEKRVRAGYDPDGAPAVAAALRLIAADASARGIELPELAAVLYHLGSHIEVRLVTEAELPEPFTSIDGDQRWWTCPLVVVRPDAAANQPAPYPALTALGLDTDGANVLIDLENSGSLVLTGHPDQTTSVLRRLLLDLAGSAFADHLAILLASDADLLIGDVPGDRVTVYADVEEALSDLEQASQAAVALLEDHQATTMRQVRPTGALPEAEPTYILISDLPLTDAQQQRLGAVLENPTAAPAAAILSAGPGQQLAVRGWTLPVDGTPVRIAPTGTTVTIQGMDEDTHELLSDLIATASTTSSVADPAWADALDAALTASGSPQTGPYHHLPAPGAASLPPVLVSPGAADFDRLFADSGLNGYTHASEDGFLADDRAEAASADAGGVEPAPVQPPAGPRVLLLGTVEVTGRAGTDQRGRELRLTEMAAYLVLNPDRGHDALAAALWPDSENPRHPEMTRLRHWLGKDEDGRWFLPLRSYRFQSVSSDWEEFLEHVVSGNLTAALALVRDQPLTGTAARRYGWAEYDRQMMIGRIADVAVAVAEKRIAARDFDAARDAAMTGLKVSPENEELSRLAMEALLGARRRGEASDIADAVLRLCDTLGVDPEPATLEIIGRVRGLIDA